MIEELIQVAEGELKLVDELTKARVYVLFFQLSVPESKTNPWRRWEELAEKPRPGQWTYFERDTHTPEKS